MYRSRDPQRLIHPALLLLWAVVLVAIGTLMRLPTRDQLSEVRGVLASYSVVGRHTTVLRFQDGRSIWTDSVDAEHADDAFATKPVAIRAFVDPNSAAQPIAGAVKAYGMYISGRTIRTVDSALARDRFLLRVVFPALGIGPACIGLILNLRRRRAYEERSQIAFNAEQSATESASTELNASKPQALTSQWTPGRALFAVLLILSVLSGVRQLPLMWVLAEKGAPLDGTVLETSPGNLSESLWVKVPNSGQTRVVHVRDAFFYLGRTGDEISVLVAPNQQEAIRAGFLGWFDMGAEMVCLACATFFVWKLSIARSRT